MTNHMAAPTAPEGPSGPSTPLITGIDSGLWVAVPDEDITVNQMGPTPGSPLILNADTNPNLRLNINITYDIESVLDPGGGTVRFYDLDSVGEDNNNVVNGLRGPININIKNDTSVPIGLPTGLDVLSVTLRDVENGINDVNFHPVFAHYHNVPATAGTITATGQATPGQFGSVNGAPLNPNAPSQIDIGGTIPAGATATLAVTLHARDQADVNDSFTMTFDRGANFISAADRTKLEAEWAAMNPTGPTDPDPTGEVDWTALAARVEEFVATTGQWGILEEWLSPPPPAPDGGDMSYIL